MKYLIFNIRYMHDYGVTQALKFSHTRDTIEEALKFIHIKEDWYDWRIISIE